MLNLYGINSSPLKGEVSTKLTEWLTNNFMEKLNNHKHLKEIRKELRNNPTAAENTLWQFLRKSQLDGKKFRRQHSIGNYIVDFYCPSEKLAIELDGGYHNETAQQLNDNERDLFLESAEVRVLRFENAEVFTDVERVLDAIKQAFIITTPSLRDTPP